jgi:hypothetical protein
MPPSHGRRNGPKRRRRITAGASPDDRSRKSQIRHLVHVNISKPVKYFGSGLRLRLGLRLCLWLQFLSANRRDHSQSDERGTD